MAVKKIIAKKGDRHRQFNETEWNLLGKNKNGWVQVSDITVENTVKPASGEKKIVAPPASGEKNKIKKPEEIVVTNSVKENKVDDIGDVKTKNVPDEIRVDNTVNNSNTGEITKEQKDEFMLSLEGITTTVIKDYFDNCKPSIAYDKKTKLPDLKLMLAEHFKYDMVAKQKAFSL